MVVAGDEFGRTQGGNNNAYCQDDAISWLEWNLDPEGESLLAFTRQLIRLRRDHIVFRRGRFFQGATIPGTDVKDVTWLRADGVEMTESDWANAQAKMLCLLLSGEAGLMHLTARGDEETDDTFLLIVNAAHEDVTQKLPTGAAGQRWETLIDTAREDGDEGGERFAPGEEIGLIARSAKLLIRRADD
jgi:glycogen operon protein